MAIDLSKSRRKLPADTINRSSYSILSVLKQAMGKDLMRFSVPITFGEPLSFLQRLSECVEYSSLLDQAASSNSNVERFHFITAFVVSTLSAHVERMSKPSNPLLGETFELKNEGNSPFHLIAEQVSHHPPISAVYVRGTNWTLTINLKPKMKFQGTHVVANSEGRCVFRISKKMSLSRSSSKSSFHSCTEDATVQEKQTPTSLEDEDQEYEWKSPDIIFHNIIFGGIWSEFQDRIVLRHIQSNQSAILIFKPHGWFESYATKVANLFQYSGFIYDGDNKIGAFHGNYGHCYYAIDDLNDTESKTTKSCSAGGHNCIHLGYDPRAYPPCNMILTPSSRLIWYRNLSPITEEELHMRPYYYYFTPFTMCLNEAIYSSPFALPPTDSRYRQDIRFLENGDLEGAANEKHRLEEKQRAEARERVGVFQPLWFTKDENDEYIYTGEYEKRNFDHCPNLFSQLSFL